MWQRTDPYPMEHRHPWGTMMWLEKRCKNFQNSTPSGPVEEVELLIMIICLEEGRHSIVSWNKTWPVHVQLVECVFQKVGRYTSQTSLIWSGKVA